MTGSAVAIRELAAADLEDCARILHSLPDWFGLEESNRSYLARLRTAPGAVAAIDGETVGFIGLLGHGPTSVEIDVMAVVRERHRQGVGRALVGWAEDWCVARGIPWLHVKTRGPTTPDPEYDRTRRFYLGVGFAPLFETLELWGPENAALVLVKHLACGADRSGSG